MPEKQTMTKSDGSRIQSTQAQNGGDMSSKGFAAHAQSAGDRNTNSGSTNAANTGTSSSVGSGGNASAGASSTWK